MAYFFRDYNFGADYFKDMVTWFAPLPETVANWRQRWQRDDQSVRPLLYLKRTGESGVVQDSRTGERIERQLRAAGVEILHA
jgi:hypothetical protein